MGPDSDRISAVIWLVLLAVAFVSGLVVVGQAFAANVPMIDPYTLRVSADYSAEPHAVLAAKIPQLDRAVIADTLRDISFEKQPVPVLGLEASVTPTPTPKRSRTPTPARITPSITPQPASEATAIASEEATSVPTTGSAAGDPPASDGPSNSGGHVRATATQPPVATPANTPRPSSTPRPENTPRPTSTPRPTDLPTATNTPEPTATNTPEPTATNTPEPTATDVSTNPADQPTNAPIDTGDSSGAAGQATPTAVDE